MKFLENLPFSGLKIIDSIYRCILFILVRVLKFLIQICKISISIDVKLPVIHFKVQWHAKWVPSIFQVVILICISWFNSIKVNCWFCLSNSTLANCPDSGFPPTIIFLCILHCLNSVWRGESTQKVDLSKWPCLVDTNCVQ